MPGHADESLLNSVDTVAPTRHLVATARRLSQNCFTNLCLLHGNRTRSRHWHIKVISIAGEPCAERASRLLLATHPAAGQLSMYNAPHAHLFTSLVTRAQVKLLLSWLRRVAYGLNRLIGRTEGFVFFDIGMVCADSLAWRAYVCRT